MISLEMLGMNLFEILVTRPLPIYGMLAVLGGLWILQKTVFKELIEEK